MLEVALLCRLLLAGVLSVSATAKLLDRPGTREAVAAFGVPPRWVPAVAALLAPVELAVAGALVLVAAPSVGPVAALLLLGAFTTAVVVNLRRGRHPLCHCFGRLGSSGISSRTVVRNAALAAAAAVAAASPPVSLTGLLDAEGGAVVGPVAVGAALAVAALLGGEARADRRREQQRSTAGVQRLVADLEQRGDRGPAADFCLPALTGASVRLADLLPDDGPLLLAFLSPGCGPCKRLRPFVARWNEVFADRLTIAAVVSGTRESNLASYGSGGFPVLLDEDRAVAASYGVPGRPSAVVVSPQGRLLGPVADGDLAVRRLVEELVTGALARRAPDSPADALDLASSPAPRPTVTTVVDEQVLVVVDETTGASVRLEDTGALVWQCLDGTSTLADIVADLAECFQAPQDRVAQDVLALVRSLGRAGLLAGTAADEAPLTGVPHQDERSRSEAGLVGSP